MASLDLPHVPGTLLPTPDGTADLGVAAGWSERCRERKFIVRKNEFRATDIFRVVDLNSRDEGAVDAENLFDIRTMA